jgi:hypothetical protein
LGVEIEWATPKMGDKKKLVQPVTNCKAVRRLSVNGAVQLIKNARLRKENIKRSKRFSHSP